MSGPGREGLGVCSAPGLSLFPARTPPPTTQPVRLEQRRGEPQDLWWGGGKIMSKCHRFTCGNCLSRGGISRQA